MPCLARLCPAWPCLRASVPLILAFLALVAAPRLLSAQGEGLGQGVGGGMMPMGGGNQQWNIMVTPQSYFTSRADNTVRGRARITDIADYRNGRYVGVRL